MATEGAGCFAVLELFGHRQVPGFVQDVRWLGADFVQITVPGLKRDLEGRVVGLDLEQPVLQQKYHPGAIFCCTPTTEHAIQRGVEEFLRCSGYRSGTLALPPPGTPPQAESEIVRAEPGDEEGDDPDDIDDGRASASAEEEEVL